MISGAAKSDLRSGVKSLSQVFELIPVLKLVNAEGDTDIRANEVPPQGFSRTHRPKIQ